MTCRIECLAVLLLLLISYAGAGATVVGRRRGDFFGEQYDLNSGDPDKSSGERWLGKSGIGTEPFDEVERIPPKYNNNTIRRAPTPPSPAWRTYIGSQREDPVGVIPAEANTPSPTASVDEVFCDFGPLPIASLCEWQDGCGALTWTPGTGLGANWLGGPLVDSTSGTSEGGYGFLETSHLAGKTSGLQDTVGPNGLLHSPQLGSTGTSGTCFTFKYAMDGLSSAGLRAHLHVGFDEFSSTFVRANESSPRTMSCSRPPPIAGTSAVAVEERVLWHAHYHHLGTWQTAQILYTYPDIHTLIIEGIPVEATDPSRSYRGYVAIDDVDLQPGSTCIGFCNFASGFCDWGNDLDDDFDWSISRGSNNPTTGPVADRDATLSSGGYAYIDSSFPRRPGDLARLISVSFPSSAADAPQCMHFSFHMFGSGVGELRIALRHSRTLEATLQEIWRLKGNAGNSWFDSRVTISSLDDFQIVFEATVGHTGMGDIAIDDISFTNGPCPTSPQVAAPTNFPRDCTFEIDECEWVNSREPSSTAISGPTATLPNRGRVDWERVSQSTLNPRNQRKPYTLPSTRPRQEYFMALQTRGVTPPTTGTASIVGAPIKPGGEPICLTFWYLMFESFIDNTGPSLGVLRVLIQPTAESLDAATPVWQLYNNQGPTWYFAQVGITEKREYSIIFEGTWGPNRANGNIAIDDIAFYTGNCTVQPTSASVRSEDCSFEKGLCGWENVTSSGVNDPRMQWQRAFTNHRPAQLLDKTFGSTGDFVFFDIFSPTQRREVRLRSPVIRPSSLDEDAVCFTFWFVAFGVEENTSLKIIKGPSKDVGEEGSREGSEEEEEREQVLWSLIAKGYNNLRPSWTWAQVTIEPRAAYRIILEGSGSNGGFAIDDIKFQPNVCPIRPAAAKPSSLTPEFK